MSIKFNVFTGMFDYIGMSATERDAYLKLNQTVAQKVVYGTPQFDKGIKITAGERLTLDGA